ncbi:hypothetical protein PFISCL1PPCAC_10451, partial [Pristionchus fissidentatus]
QMTIRSCPQETMQSGIVTGRLRGKGADCDLVNLACRVNLCGRTFDTVQVLAWHMSYSHTDLSSRSSNASFCFVCGHQMGTAKGKVAHLLSKHRDIFQQHHTQCLNQRQIVYAPNAPGAVRIRESRMEDELIAIKERHESKRFFDNQMAYSERRVVGYSREQMFDVVAHVEKYHEFVPWCVRSTVSHEGPHSQLAHLEVGFQIINASYASRVTLVRPSVVHSVCADPDGGLFRVLDTTWRFSAPPGGDSVNSCRIHFDLSFEFRSAVHARITHLFFDKVVQQQVSAFLDRARSIHGPPSHPPSAPEILKYEA